MVNNIHGHHAVLCSAFLNMLTVSFLLLGSIRKTPFTARLSRKGSDVISTSSTSSSLSCHLQGWPPRPQRQSALGQLSWLPCKYIPGCVSQRLHESRTPQQGAQPALPRQGARPQLKQATAYYWRTQHIACQGKQKPLYPHG